MPRSIAWGVPFASREEAETKMSLRTKELSGEILRKSLSTSDSRYRTLLSSGANHWTKLYKF